MLVFFRVCNQPCNHCFARPALKKGIYLTFCKMFSLQIILYLVARTSSRSLSGAPGINFKVFVLMAISHACQFNILIIIPGIKIYRWVTGRLEILLNHRPRICTFGSLHKNNKFQY